MVYDEEFNQKIIDQCEDLVKGESYDDWAFFADLVLNNLEIIGNLTILKILKNIGMYTSILGKKHSAMDPRIMYLLFAQRTYGLSRDVLERKDVLRRGLQNILATEVELREYRSGRSSRYDAKKRALDP